MVTSGTEIEYISEKIAILKHEIVQCGKLGLLNINKHCEQLVKGLLERIDGVTLRNLNENAVNFPGIDLGSEADKIAYQVTSQTDNQKVEETLKKVVAHKHYIKFPTLKIFMLKDKRDNYSGVTIPVEAGFSFDVKKDIVDFTDLLKQMQVLDSNRISDIKKFVDTQLPYTIAALKQQETQAEIKNDKLINIEEGLAISKLPYFAHWSVQLTIHGANLSTPKIFQGLNNVLNNYYKKRFLPIVNPMFLKGPGAKEISYVQPLKDTGVTNHYKTAVLKIQNQSIKFEAAQFYSQALILDNLNDYMGGLLTLIMALREFIPGANFTVEVDANLSSNAEFTFYDQVSIYSVERVLNPFVLDEGDYSFSRLMKTFTNEEYMELMSDLLEGFVCKKQTYQVSLPFMQIDTNNQNIALTNLRNLIGPTLTELNK